jgi:Cdc6-like AAA superfamily ATPase
MSDKETPPNARIGEGKPGPGRPKGTPNKSTAAVREVFSQLVEANAEKAQALFDRVADKDPAKALELLARLSEFVVPKLARTETTLDAGTGLLGALAELNRRRRS